MGVSTQNWHEIPSHWWLIFSNVYTRLCMALWDYQSTEAPGKTKKNVEMYDFTGLNSRCSDSDFSQVWQENQWPKGKWTVTWHTTGTAGIKWFELCFPFLKRMCLQAIPRNHEPTKTYKHWVWVFCPRMPHREKVALSLESVKVVYVSQRNIHGTVPIYHFT